MIIPPLWGEPDPSLFTFLGHGGDIGVSMSLVLPISALT